MEEVKRGENSELRFGIASAPVKLFKATGSDPKSRKFDTAGPNGLPLRMETRAAEADEEETAADVLGVTPVKEEEPAPTDPGPEAIPPVEEEETPAPASESVPGAKRRVLVEEGTGEEVEPDDVRKGLRIDDETFVDLTQHLEKVEEESRVEGLEALGFIRRERVPRERVVSSYFLGSDGKSSARLIRALYEGMKETGRVAVVRWTKRKGQSLGILTPRGDGAMIVLELAFAEVCRKPNARCLAHLRAEVSRDMVGHVETAIESMEWSPDRLDEIRNRRVELEQDLIDRAEAGKVEGHEIRPEKADEGMDDLAEILAKVAA